MKHWIRCSLQLLIYFSVDIFTVFSFGDDNDVRNELMLDGSPGLFNALDLRGRMGELEMQHTGQNPHLDPT